MKNKLHKFIALAILLVTGLMFQSCNGEKYTVWTDHITYSEFQSSYNITLNDGYYVRAEISKSQWSEISKYLTAEGRHRWDEETIRKWLISNGFGETEATKESSWFVVTEHGLLVTRTGNMVYLILK